MTIAELIKSGVGVAGTTGSGRPCAFAAILTRLDDVDREAVVEAITTPIFEGGRSDDAVASALRRGGHRIGESTIRRHRLGRCACTNPPAPAIGSRAEVAA